ncbi:formate dehydrogenase subunit alpha [Limnobacter parvus]|uniref:Formate dehydrogenase subunit alpha n=1 Tax=Limnobacter parvus TaxID=2939690 RepID=A0ABT1XMM9_9BURK|nr:formate dehydrogenase subunit alpha [Limnobacter parvus]MCR2747349.1 formate dehydrogenase subunit alpha [Limnobacter parvus]
MNTRNMIGFQLNGEQVQALPGETLLQVAQREGINVPHLCHKNGLEPAGNCRACMVEIDGERTLAASCCRQVEAGMVVTTDSAKAVASQRMVLELLLADMPENTNLAALKADNELAHWCEIMGIDGTRFDARAPVPPDYSHPAIAVNLDHCIQCTRCVRACREVQVNDVIGLAHRGEHATIVFDQGDALAQSTCVACGECVQACPTGALSPAKPNAHQQADKTIDSVCPYCGVGCQLTYHVKDNTILRVEGQNGPANAGRLCVKGRYGFDYVHHEQRLTHPLIRREGVPKNPVDLLNTEQVHTAFRQASWEEALALVASKLKQIKTTHGGNALAGFGSAKGSNEEAYLFQKLVRTGFGTNNVDHCTRLCHASSVAALLEGIGSGAVSNPLMDVDQAEVIFVIGANPTVNHPVGATWIKNAVKKGAKLIVADPRRSDLARHATHFLQFKADSDVALLNALLHVIIDENLINTEFIKTRTEGFDALKANVATCTPEAMAPICGIPASELRAVARLYAKSKSAMILWGMGISQHTHGTDNARCLISLALITGQIGRPGTGLHPLRGQNNVQGASDAGLIPMMYPDYQPVGNTEAQRRFETLWNTPLSSTPGLTVVETMQAILAGTVKGMYILGENPAMSDPDLNHARKALAALDFLVVQDIFLTETATLADVVLPASAFPEKTGTFTNTDRLVQLGQQAIDPPGLARQDLWIIQSIAQGLGLSWNYQTVEDVFDEMRRAMHSIEGITWQRLQREHAVVYPCLHEGDAGQAVVFTEEFPTHSGKARLVPAQYRGAAEKPDVEFPFVLITGRQLEHWHTGSMTRRASVLDAIEPEPTALFNPSDLNSLNIQPGDKVSLRSRRGEITIFARADSCTPQGNVFVPFCYAEAAINKLTHAALDPHGKIPEFKYCAIAVHKN